MGLQARADAPGAFVVGLAIAVAAVTFSIQAEAGPPNALPVEAKKPPPEPGDAGVPEPRATGWLACTTSPTGAEVYVDGENTRRKTPVPKSQALELPVGTHELSFKFNGTLSAPQPIHIRESEVTVVKVRL